MFEYFDRNINLFFYVKTFFPKEKGE